MASPANLLFFEQPLTKVPYEQLRKGFRTTQRNFERDFTLLASSASDLGNIASQSLLDDGDARLSAEATIDAMIARVEGLKRKLADVQQKSTTPMQHALRARTDHLIAFESTSPTDAAYQHWVDTRMDRWLVDSMLRSGRFESASALAEEKGIQPLVDGSVFEEIQRITLAMRRQSCAEALAWCNENKASLRKAKSTLEFELRMQEFIELVRVGKFVPAIAYSKKHLASWHDTHPAQFGQAMMLLAYGPRMPKNATYRKLYDVERWQLLAGTFQETAYGLTALASSPLLSLALYAGLSALKHPACLEEADDHDDEHSGKNQDCPVCDSAGLGVLAREVPGSQHHNSTLVCAMSGAIMDDNNPPMSFKNGYVYSRSALQEMADRNNGMVICPRTNQTMAFKDLRKVFVT